MPSNRALAGVIRPTTLIESFRLSRKLGAEITLASESFQHTGSFKFRAAYNLAANVPHAKIITASSGNFGQALACACAMLGKSCVVVMPHTSARIKMDAVREFGGKIEIVDVRVKTRAARVAELGKENPEACLASAYDDPFVIEGNASLGHELGQCGRSWDYILAPVGGGGLTSGLITGLRAVGSEIPVIGIEPILANDAARSLRAGQLIVNEQEPQTLADGVRTLSLGKNNWAILQRGLREIIEVSEEQIREAVRLLFNVANLKAEPTGALSVAGVLAAGERFAGKSICCVISGGNVDPDLFRTLLEK
ncbi:MAG: threonine/serine dehydratase [Verrucomicrobiota bacterium]